MRAGEAGFVSLADALRSHVPSASQAASPPSSATPPPEPPVPGPTVAAVADPGSMHDVAPAAFAETRAAVTAARVFRAVLADTLEAVVADLAREIAVEIVARELRLGGADIARIVNRLSAERAADGPVRVRVAPADAGLSCDLPVLVDETLCPGDAVLECRTGLIDARLGVRLAWLLTESGR